MRVPSDDVARAKARYIAGATIGLDGVARMTAEIAAAETFDNLLAALVGCGIAAGYEKLAEHMGELHPRDTYTGAQVSHMCYIMAAVAAQAAARVSEGGDDDGDNDGE